MKSTTIKTNLSSMKSETLLNVLNGFNRDDLRKICRSTGTTQGKDKLEMVANLGHTIKGSKSDLNLQLTF